jgi:hypothetical protein
MTRNIQEKERISLDFSRTRKAFLKLTVAYKMYDYRVTVVTVTVSCSSFSGCKSLGNPAAVLDQYIMVASTAKRRISSCLKQDDDQKEIPSVQSAEPGK